MKKVRLNIIVDEELKKKLGVKAVLEGKRLSTVVEELLKKCLEKETEEFKI